MPADAWAVQFPVGKCSSGASREEQSGTRERLTHNPSGAQHASLGPKTRDHMLSQNRIDDTLLVREAQRGNRTAFEELVRHYDQAVLRLALHLT
ncbi:MAG TPA: hypothetical protein VF447_13870, partial [Terriglobales bacterium]